MAYFAKLDKDNKVVDIISVNNNELLDDSGREVEQKGIDFLTHVTNYSNWVQTSYNASFRKNYAVIGGIYDISRDAFISPKIHQSWVLNESGCYWEPPVPMPEDSNVKCYIWDEATVSWAEKEEQ